MNIIMYYNCSYNYSLHHKCSRRIEAESVHGNHFENALYKGLK